MIEINDNPSARFHTPQVTRDGITYYARTTLSVGARVSWCGDDLTGAVIGASNTWAVVERDGGRIEAWPLADIKVIASPPETDRSLEPVGPIDAIDRLARDADLLAAIDASKGDYPEHPDVGDIRPIVELRIRGACEEIWSGLRSDKLRDELQRMEAVLGYGPD